MRSPSAPVDPGFDVVVLGAGLNSLNLTIAFHAQYGMRCTTVVRTPVAMNERTVTTDLVTLGADASDEDLRDALIDLAAQRPAGRPALLLTNADSLIELIDRFRADLEPHYLLAQVDAQLLSRLADKAEFAEICDELGIDTVPTVIVDFSRAGEPDWNGHEELPWSYPVVGKAANTAEYHHVDFPGKKKVFFLESAEEQRALVRSLREAGFTGRFLFQELIEGDDTAQRSITAYRSSRGRVTLLCAAQVLLGEHTPEALGRPAAMVTGDFPSLTAAAERFLDHVDYVGFANFDVKVDPRTGRECFFEINPRIGRNNYYVTAAGEPVARHVVEDRVHGRDIAQVRVTRPILYTILPLRLVLSYVRDPALREHVRGVARRGLRNPFRYRPEGLWMRAYSVVSGLNFVRKYRAVYPRPTDTGF
ncbi:MULTISPECIES: carboxylate--amine ligase [Brachybacterium]|uniref:Carboxylate--amine ligase n=2 Tax=Brachybacterium TaxID=43668 RepID=A0A3R8SFP0_9MICO|nr:MULTISPECIES: carboxylate--amine ligase [Brachybacterium]MCT1436695.1 carboxylate--amine ligase [Brachybacterium paraconglomeratum]RRR19951.1 carboxylate--amine ligase [Brachybacterium paraconglomeratum]GLI31793.1 carboxylate--amine ligase [Brachybacterium conglomeratum]GLK03326.1 carboxylate--amine ligase [Brachybacterium conglomeratum]